MPSRTGVYRFGPFQLDVNERRLLRENNINANVSILRKALGEDANGQSHIETVPRVGYRF